MKRILFSRYPSQTAPDEAAAINLVAEYMWADWGRHLDPDAPFTREVDGEIECYCSEGAMERAVKHYRDDQWFAIIEDAPEPAGQA